MNNIFELKDWSNPELLQMNKNYLKHCQNCDEKVKQNPKLKTEMCYDCRGIVVEGSNCYMKKSGERYYFFSE